MVNMDRRVFLQGAAAAAVTASMPGAVQGEATAKRRSAFRLELFPL